MDSRAFLKTPRPLIYLLMGTLTLDSWTLIVFLIFVPQSQICL